MYLLKEKLSKTILFGGILLLAFCALLVILFGVKQFKLGSQLAGDNQATNISHLLVRQQANLFSMLLQKNANADVLTENLDNFRKEQFVLNASLYAANGKLLAQSSAAKLGEERAHNELPIVEPIYSANGLEGFLRVSFDNQYGRTTQHKIDKIFHRLYGELIIVFLLGALCASSVHYFLSHYRRVKYKSRAEKTELKTTSKLAATTLYHRQRKRFRTR